MPKFQIIEVPANAVRQQEQMGTKFKFWYKDENYGYCLFKEGHPNTGEDWSERVVAELCELLEIPHAVYRLAVWQNRRGIITSSFISDDEALIPGNEVLFHHDETYPMQDKMAKKHTVETIFSAFIPLEVQLPAGKLLAGITTAQQVFLGYLMLDVWVSNTDRHHENWALVRKTENEIIVNRLAPTHDHAASLGCILGDNERLDRLTTKDRNRTVEAYVNSSKARSVIYKTETDKKPLPLFDAFKLASLHNPQASELWIKKLESVKINDISDIFERIPDERISDVAKKFAMRLLETNRQRLLDFRK